MKKVLVFLFATSILYSCGSGDSGNSNAETPKPAETPAATQQSPALAQERGLELIGGSDCTACHAIDKKLIGPSYTEIANKYDATDEVIETLIGKIKTGGMGNWGNIPMTPHPTLADADIREMVQYILSLKQ